MSSNKKIRVLETIRQGKIGGGESHVLDLVGTMDRTAFEPVVLSFTDGPMIHALEKIGVQADVIHSEKPFDFKVWKQVKTYMKENRIDLVHVHGTRANSNVLWAARRLKLPVIYTIHGWSFHEGLHPVSRRLRIAAEKFITRRADVNICVSESNRHTGEKAFGKFDATVIHNGVNLEKFNPDAAYPDVRAQYGFSAEDIVIAYIVRITLQKDPINMIQAFAQAQQQVPALKLLMVGEGDLRQEAMETAARLGLTGKVIFDNFRQDVPAVLNAADIYCLPSLWEGFPIGVLEAMAMGKAVIASDVDGTREAVQHESNGLLVPARDAGALAAALVRLANDNALRTSLQQQAKETIRKTYNVGNMTRKIEEVYRRLSVR